MGGRPPVTDDDEEVLDVVRDSDLPVVGTKHVKDALGFSTNKGAAGRLEKLVEKGKLETGLIGRTRIWWIPRESDE